MLTRLVNLGLRIVRSPVIERQITWQGIVTAVGFSVASFTAYGTCVWVLAVAVGAPAGEAFPICLAGWRWV